MKEKLVSRSSSSTDAVTHNDDSVGDCMSLDLKIVELDGSDDFTDTGILSHRSGGRNRPPSALPAQRSADAMPTRSLDRPIVAATADESDESDNDMEDGDYPSPGTTGVTDDSNDDSDYAGHATATILSPSPSPLTRAIAAVIEATSPPVPSLAPIHFEGNFSNTFAGGISQRDRSIRGKVELNVEGAVCWSFIIHYNGEDQWQMEGIQVGGIQSRYGILGAWSSADHDNAGPNGPFWYWPHISDA